MVQLMRRSRQARAAERMLEMRIPVPKGRYTVELSDARTGKIVERFEQDNYVTPAHYRRAAHFQGILPFMHGILLSGLHDRTQIATNASVVANRWAFNPFHAPHCPDSAVVCSNWGEAEDTAVDWAKGNISAWASLIKTTIDAAGKRGLINESENALNANMEVVKWVWDWTTQQGNGSFQSVILGTVGTKINAHVTFPIASGQRATTVNYTGLSINTVCLNSVTHDPDTGDIYALVYLAANGGTPRLAKWTAAELAASGSLDGSGLWNKSDAGSIASTPPSMVFTNALTSSTSVHFDTPSLVKIPGTSDIVMIGRQNNGTLQVVRFNASTGASVYNNTATGATAGTAGTTTKVTSACYAGTKIWALAGEFQAANLPSVFPTNGYVMRIEPSTGAVEATLPLPSGCHSWNSIVSDGTLLLVSTNLGIIVMDQVGANVEPYNLGQVAIRGQDDSNTVSDQARISNTNGYDLSERLQDSAASPQTGGPYWQGLSKGSRDYAYPRTGVFVYNPRTGGYNSPGVDALFPWASNYGSSVGTCMQVVEQSVSRGHPIYVWNGDKLWVVGRSWIRTLDNALSTDTFGLISCDGSNMFSRAVLETPATKTSSQNMKISYELTLPEEWYGVVPHVNPLA